MSEASLDEVKLRPQDVLEFHDQESFQILAENIDNQKHELSYAEPLKLGVGVAFGSHHKHTSPLEETEAIDVKQDVDDRWNESFLVSTGASFGRMFEQVCSKLGRGFEFVTPVPLDVYLDVPVNSTSVSVGVFAKRDKSIRQLDVEKVVLSDAAKQLLQEKGIEGWIQEYGQYCVVETVDSCYFAAALYIEGHAKYEQTRLEQVLGNYRDKLLSTSEEDAGVGEALRDETAALGTVRAVGMGLAVLMTGDESDQEPTANVEVNDAETLVNALRSKFKLYEQNSESKWNGVPSRVKLLAWTQIPAFTKAVEELDLEAALQDHMLLPSVSILAAIQEAQQRVAIIQKRAKRLMELDFYPGPTSVQETYRKRVETLTTQWAPGIEQTLRHMGPELLPRLNLEARDWWNFMSGIRDAEIFLTDLETGKCYIEVTGKVSKSWFGWNSVSSKARCVISTKFEHHSFDNTAIYPRFSVISYHFDPEEKRAEFLWKLTGRGESDAQSMDFELRNCDISSWKKIDAKYTYQTMDALLSIKFLDVPVYREI